MKDHGALVSCWIVEFGGITGGEYEASVEKDAEGKILASYLRKETASSRTVKKKKKIKPEVFEKLEDALLSFDFEKKASQEVIDQRKQMFALDAPIKHITVRFEKAQYDLCAEDTAEENISAARILTGFFVSAFDE